MKKKKLTLQLRINMIFFVVFLLFCLLIFQLGMLQIVDGRKYADQLKNPDEVIVKKSVPRGRIFDRNGKNIVDNESIHAITYTKQPNTTAHEMLDTSKKLAELITMDTVDIREQDRKDYWILTHPIEARKLITNEELKKVDHGTKTNHDIYQLQLERIPNESLTAFTSNELEIIAIFKNFNKGYALTSQIVKNEGVTYDELARVNENLANLPGVDTTIDWTRKYPYGNTLKSILGKVSTSSEGLPQEKIDLYLSMGYDRNDRVGKSYLEEQYEDLLRGQKEKIKHITDNKGNMINSETISPGQRGKDLVLTIDIDLQIEVETIITEELEKRKTSNETTFLDRAFVVLTNPQTGEILTMAGKQYQINPDTKQVEINDFALGTFTTAYAMGSVVKGATILTGYSTGVIHPGDQLLDEVIQIQGTPPKKSWTSYGMGMISDLDALRQSSNVFMFKTAIAIGNGHYIPNAPLKLDKQAFQVMRNHFSQFGLGIQTGIDLPGEQIGYKGGDEKSGFLLDYSIGQYDTFTPMQLAQYVSTIANGGKRVKPHILKEVREPNSDDHSLGSLLTEIHPVILNTLSNTPEEISQVQEGFREVTQQTGGTAKRYFEGVTYNPAGKTGTAEAFYDGPNWVQGTTQPPTNNTTFVSYAPFDNPEVALCVVVPWAFQSSDNHINLDIARRVMDAYFSRKNQLTELK